MTSTISVQNLRKTYKVPTREPGLVAALKSIVSPQYRIVEAVKNVSFEIAQGESVGFIGPNGAGKTTTLKMLSGILHPTTGKVSIMGATPWKREPLFLKQIAMVRGSRPLALPIELTVSDAFEFQKLVYEVESNNFRRNLNELVELLSLTSLLDRQLRALSLGERMKVGLAWSLLYEPKVLFLDEPTLGLDISVTKAIREFIGRYRLQHDASIILTSHFMSDVDALCSRLILISEGSVIYDGSREGLSQRLMAKKVLKVYTNDAKAFPEHYGDIVEIGDGYFVLNVAKEKVPRVAADLLSNPSVTDFEIAEPSLELLIGDVFDAGSVPSA